MRRKYFLEMTANGAVSEEKGFCVSAHWRDSTAKTILLAQCHYRGQIEAFSMSWKGLPCKDIIQLGKTLNKKSVMSVM